MDESSEEEESEEEGEAERALYLLEEMQPQGLALSEITYNVAISACNKSL